MESKLSWTGHEFSFHAAAFGYLTERRLDQTPHLMPPAPFPIPLLIPLFRWITTVFIFFIWPKLLTILLSRVVLSGRRKTHAVSSLSLMVGISRLGLKKYFRSSCLPCGVRARCEKSPYTERPSLGPEEARLGPWL